MRQKGTIIFTAVLAIVGVAADYCYDNEFKCVDDNSCILDWWFCNGIPGCGDGSDEIHPNNKSVIGTLCRQDSYICRLPADQMLKSKWLCTKNHRCDYNEFKCLDGRRCISRRDFCDGYADCPDGSDEIDPNYKAIDGTACRQNQKICKLPKNQVRKSKWLCPKSPCDDNEFKCLDGSRCIPKGQFCDGYAQCQDGSDEIHPENKSVEGTACRRHSLICKLPKDQMLKAKWLCTKNLICDDNEFQCLDGSGCLKSKFCDERADCRDGSDKIHPNNKSVDGIVCRRKLHICILPTDQMPKSKWLCLKNYSCDDTEFKCLDGSLCLQGSSFCDGYADCPDGSDEIHPNDKSVDGIACRRESLICKLPTDQMLKSKQLCPKNLNCNNNEFKCLDGSGCLPKWLFCNGYHNCGDGSDEIRLNNESVNGTSCHHYDFVCKLPTNQMGKRKWICQKNVTCDDNKFKCFNENRCISGSRFCDGFWNCNDGSDEISPNNQNVSGIACRRASHICKLSTNQMLKSKWLCQKNHSCNDNEFKCLDGNRCISNSDFCDGHEHCRDGSDEIYLNDKSVKGTVCRRDILFCKLPTDRMLNFKLLCSKNHSCDDKEFKCLDGSGCVQKSKFCDGIKQCRDGSDEIHPLNKSVNGIACRQDSLICKLPADQILRSKWLCTKNVSCDDNEYKCLHENRCIQKTAFCNRRIDCRDGSDEFYLNNKIINGTACRQASFICKLPSHQMLKSKWLCTKSFSCDDNEFRCLDKSRCVRKSYFCDGFPDCRDGSDEIHLNSKRISGIACRRKSRICKLPRDQMLKSKWLCR